MKYFYKNKKRGMKNVSRHEMIPGCESNSLCGFLNSSNDDDDDGDRSDRIV